MRDENPYRLNPAVTPQSYEITLQINPDIDEFSGRERIVGLLVATTTSIELNSVDLVITAATISGVNGTIPVTAILVPEHEILQLNVETPIEPQAITIELAFTGTLRSDLSGLYRSTYTDDKGVIHNLATTQFESTDARKAFPCFDEPDSKATFAISCEVPHHLAAISNYPEISRQTLDDGTTDLVRFATTMPMSTYLVAVIVGALETTEPVLERSVPIRIVHSPNKSSLTSFALEVGAHALRFFEDWFGIPYPAPKLDLIAIPDFAFGAMENLGAVTFRETALLVDKEAAAEVELERVSDVICHEIAHMWFGDLVTMKWWNGIWLNEAFATYMEINATDAYRPSWKRWESFGVSRVAALGVDSLSWTRPIEYEVVAPADAENMFDLLTYEKGGSVLKMAEVFLGLDIFRTGIKRYLTKHAHGNAETNDLWHALEEASSKPVAEIMNTWILQGGHPVVSVESLPDGVRITQSPFRLLNRDTDPIGEIGSSWEIPIVARDLRGNEMRLLMTQNEHTLRSEFSPLIINAGGFGVYRTRYSQPLLAQLQEVFFDLEPLERFNLVSDTWWLAVADMTNLASAIELFRLCRDESDPNVLAVVADALALIDRIAQPEEHGLVAATVRAIFNPVLERIGMEPNPDDEPTTRTARATLIHSLGTIGDDREVRELATQWFREEMSGVGGPPGDLVSAVLAVVAHTGDESEFAFVLDRYRHPRDPQDEQRHLFAMAGFRQGTLATRLLSACIGEVRSQDGPFVVNRVLANPATQEVALDFLFEHYEALLARFPANTRARMLSSLSSVVGPETHQRSNEIFRFFDSHPLPAGDRLLRQTLERYRANLRLRDRLSGSLSSYLSHG
ncbi:MAG: M1 family metallopeptidase [Ferrimicrobium sp.]